MSIDTKEKLLVAALVSDKELFNKTNRIIKPEYFDTPLDTIVKFIQDYYIEYKDTPTTDIIFAETEIRLEEQNTFSSGEFLYLHDEIETHCKDNAMRIAILQSADILSDDSVTSYGEIQELVKSALMIRIDNNIGSDLSVDARGIFSQMAQKTKVQPVGVESIDDLLGGGTKRQELGMFCGGSGSGKSVILANMACLYSILGYDVVLYSLELAEHFIAKRLFSILTGVDIKTIVDKEDDVVECLEELYKEKGYGKILVKRLALGSDANTIRTHLSEWELLFKSKPDVIITDYLDLLTPISKAHMDVTERDKMKTEELREIVIDYNAFGFTASQLNRDAVDVDKKGQQHIAGGLSKIHTVDYAFAITRNEAELDGNLVGLNLMKLRDGEFSHEMKYSSLSPKTLKLSNVGAMSVNNANTDNTNDPQKQKKSTNTKRTSSASERMQKILNKKH